MFVREFGIDDRVNDRDGIDVRVNDREEEREDDSVFFLFLFCLCISV